MLREREREREIFRVSGHVRIERERFRVPRELRREQEREERDF
jgi:hypothetical protein